MWMPSCMCWCLVFVPGVNRQHMSQPTSGIVPPLTCDPHFIISHPVHPQVQWLRGGGGCNTMQPRVYDYHHGASHPSKHNRPRSAVLSLSGSPLSPPPPPPPPPPPLNVCQNSVTYICPRLIAINWMGAAPSWGVGSLDRQRDKLNGTSSQMHPEEWLPA